MPDLIEFRHGDMHEPSCAEDFEDLLLEVSGDGLHQSETSLDRVTCVPNLSQMPEYSSQS